MSAFEIVVGKRSEKSTVSRQLSCHVSITNDAGEERWRRHESLVNEPVLYDAKGIAWLVSDVLRGPFAEENTDAVLIRVTPAAGELVVIALRTVRESVSVALRAVV